MFKIQATHGGHDAGSGAQILGEFAGRLFATETEAEAAVAELRSSDPGDGYEGIEYEVVEAREREVREYLDGRIEAEALAAAKGFV